MDEYIIHYDDLSRYDDPVFVSDRTLETILLAKEEHKKRNERHIFQCKLVPKENSLRYSYHINPCYSKLTESNLQKRADSIDKSIQNSNSIDKKSKSASTRTTRKKLTTGSSPVKRAKRKRSSSLTEQCATRNRL